MLKQKLLAFILLSTTLPDPREWLLNIMSKWDHFMFAFYSLNEIEQKSWNMN